tara:strand:+ start:18744 stop:22001 length:3258 start_codon:yes stop_codon:yes gene_type:complete
MSRIYQGGQSNSEYKSKERRVRYNPTSQISNQQAILDEGKRTQRNLKTQDRELKRKADTQNLERQSADKVIASTLKDEHDLAARELKLEQQVDSANNEISRMLAESDLKMGQTSERGAVSIEQLKDKNALQYKNIIEKNSLELEQLKETNALKSDHAAKRADNNLQLQHMQFKANVDNANFQVVKTAVMGLIQFSGQIYKDQAALIDERNEKEKNALEGLPPGVQVDGKVHGALIDDAQIDIENNAREAGILESTNSTIEAQQLRAPAVRVQTARANAQADIRTKGNNYSATLNGALDSNETKVPFRGQEMSIRDMIFAGATEEEVFDAIEDIGVVINNQHKLTMADGPEAIRSYGNKVRQANSNAKSRWGAVVSAYTKSAAVDAAKNDTAAHIGAGKYQLAWEAINKGYYTSGAFDRKSVGERQLQAVKDSLELMDADDATAMLDVLKVKDNPGTRFGDDKTYGPIIRKAIAEKLAPDGLQSKRAAAKKLEIESVIKTLDLQLADTTDPDKSLELRQQAKNYLIQNYSGNPTAESEIAALTTEGKTSEALKLEVQEHINDGRPPSMADVVAWEKAGALDPTFITKLKTKVKLLDEVNIEMKAAGFGNIEAKLSTVIGKNYVAMTKGGITDIGSQKATQAITARQLAPRVEDEMRGFIAQIPADLPQGEKTRLIEGKYAIVIKEIADILGDEKINAFDTGGFKFELLGDDFGAIPRMGQINSVTGRMVFPYTNVAIEQLPSGASSEDMILSNTAFLADAEVWNKGGNNYSERTLKAAKRFRITPKAFVEAQAIANGSENIFDGISRNTEVNFSSPQTTYNTFQAAGLTKNAAVKFGDRVSTMSIDAVDDAIASDPIRLERATKFLGMDFAKAEPRQKLEALMNDIKTFDRSSYRILRNPLSGDIQINRSIDEYFKGQQPIDFPVIDTRISNGQANAFQHRGVSTTTFLSASVPGGYGPAIAAAASKHSVDPGILAGLYHQESQYLPEVIDGTRVSSTGAQGIAQIMTEYHPGVNPLNPIEAIDYGASYLARLLKRYNGDYRLALTAYNAGEGNVDKYGGPIPGNEESMEFAGLVFGHARTYGWGQ